MKLGLLTLNNIKGNLNELEIQKMNKCITNHGDADSLLICKYAFEQLIK